MSAYDTREILPSVQDACDCLIENGFSQKVYMRINDDGTVTLVDYAVYLEQFDEKEEMDEDD